MSQNRSEQGNAAPQRVNPITASIIQGALENIAIETGYKLMRMSYSSIIRESEDFGAALCDTQGRQLCECSKSTPLQSGPIPGYVKGILKEFAERGHDFNPGDVIIHNDPYNGASHSPDIGICVPVFYDNELIGFSVTTAHHLDIGSCQAGSVGVVVCADAYAEGLRFKALKIYDAGELNNPLWQMLSDNIRVSDLVIGDINAQIAACHVGANRYVELVERYGLQLLTDAVEDLFDYSERLMRAQIEKVPDGIYCATGYIDGFLGEDDPAVKNLPLKVTLTVDHDEITVDLAGSADQVSGYAINMPFKGTVDVAIWLTLRSILLDSNIFGSIPQNDGLFRPIHIKAPKGCIANPKFPVPTIARFAPGNVLADTVMKALAPALPQQISAGVANLKAVTFSGMEKNQQWVHIEIFEGSYGGRAGKDGMDCVDTLYANTRNNPIEDIESHVPLRVTQYEFRENAIAPGKWCGGMNSVKEILFLTNGELSTEGDGHTNPPWGFAGGKKGVTSALELSRNNSATIELPSMLASIPIKRGDRMKAIGGIGGGYGNPFERSAELVRENVLDEYFNAATAEREFGVVINSDFEIDLEATNKLREETKQISAST